MPRTIAAGIGLMRVIAAIKEAAAGASRSIDEDHYGRFCLSLRRCGPPRGARELR